MRREKNTDYKKEFEKCLQEKDEYLAGWKKARADLVNLRKQDEENIKSIRSFATQNIITDIIPTLDSFDMAFSNKKAWENVSEEWRVGVEYIYNQLWSTLESHGLKRIDSVDVTFDPARHEAVENVPGKDNMIVEIVQKGYELNKKIIRVAKVKVGKS